ncbi:metallophosphoesterase family protein [Parasphingorhabdus cellanae]|uniref:Serine/threonine protein phosphatase n=1 Tax=Parasphingorhabdus cellanae TaxID=2806553 RepID=A0ABX7T4U4_9SPHN|nr:metallophosphoesterase family protein [Parasphingorhabdus cellanae]QTD56604.1 serine/threonine protein phosphatase [Parasphingorhabdus cellanae]
MLKRLFSKKLETSPLETACVPEGRRVYAIGDIHGRNDLLQQLIEKIIADDAERGDSKSEIIFLGDLVDRGPDSSGVIETAIQLKEELNDVRFLMGNHEEVYLKAATGDEKATRFFNRIGGKETILSYDISMRDYMELDNADLAERLPDLIPEHHIDFVKTFENQIIVGDYAFVHAGIRPGVALDEQKPKDLRWIREEFLSVNEPHEKVIVYGHTINDDVVEKGNRIGIDTGAYYTEKLTALALEGNHRWYLDTALPQ